MMQEPWSWECRDRERERERTSEGWQASPLYSFSLFFNVLEVAKLATIYFSCKLQADHKIWMSGFCCWDRVACQLGGRERPFGDIEEWETDSIINSRITYSLERIKMRLVSSLDQRGWALGTLTWMNCDHGTIEKNINMTFEISPSRSVERCYVTCCLVHS